MEDIFESFEKVEEKISIYVRLITTYWHDKNALHQKTTLRFLKRKMRGFNFIEEDCNMAGADEVFKKIVNLDKCEDGVYKVVMCNESKDWETGYIDDWDYMLVEDKESPKI